MPPKFFITHSWQDIEFTRRLCDDLRQHGLDGFFDMYAIKPGDDISVRIARGLEECEVYVPLLSRAAVESPWCEREIGIAIDLSMERARKGRPRIVPVIIEPCKLPTILRGILYITFDGRYTEAFNELLTKGFGVTLPPVSPKPPPEIISPPPQIITPPPPKIEAPAHSFVNSKTGKEMILIPAGEFVMGSDEGNAIEKPQHKVYLDAFYISRYPVTNAEYKKFVDETGHAVPFINKFKAKLFNWDKYKSNHPVILVSWRDANKYCEWAGVRLPTEAEWEKAASWDDTSKEKHKYPWGKDFDASKCNTDESKIGDTTPVGMFSPQGDSSYGIADMAGNVREWCSSLPHNYPYDMNDRREDAFTNSFRVIRGGSWDSDENYARCTYRALSEPNGGHNALGFRIALSLPHS